MLNSGRTHKIRSRTDAAQPRKQVGGKHKRQEKHTGNPPARLPPVHSRIRRDETVNCVFRNSKHAQKLPSLNFFLFIGTAHDRTPERVVANLSQPAHENKTILTPLRAVRNSIVTSVRSLERPAQNPKFARNLTRPTHFGICATQQLKRPSRISPLLSKLVYAATGASYTHASMAFDAELSCLYSSTRKNGYTMFPAGPSKEYLNRGVFRLRDNAPCALYALEVSDEAYSHALHRAEEFMRHSEEYSFNILGLILCALHIRWQRRRHYFCSQFVSEVLEQSGALALPKDSTLMHPNDYPLLPQLKCLYKGRLADLPQRKAMDLGETPSMVSIYTGLLVELLQRRAQSLFE